MTMEILAIVSPQITLVQPTKVKFYRHLTSLSTHALAPYFHSFYKAVFMYIKSFPGGSHGKVSACNAGDLGSIPGSERSAEKEMATCSGTLCLENPMDREAW